MILGDYILSHVSIGKPNGMRHSREKSHDYWLDKNKHKKQERTGPPPNWIISFSKNTTFPKTPKKS